MKNSFPTPAEENLLDRITLDAYLIDNREASFMLRVGGNAMQEAGICEGDFVIVERALEAKRGDIVIAVIDGAWKMKYFDSIQAKESLSITAVVKAVVRKYV